MRKLAANSLVLILLLLSWPVTSPAAPPQEQVPKGRLARIDVLGSKHWNTTQILPIVGFKSGDSVSKDDLQVAADRLSDCGLFSKVEYRYATVEDGVLLQFEVADAPMYPVLFDNFPWFTDAEITQAIQMEGLPFDGTAPSTGTILDGIAQSIQKLVATHGVNGTVNHQDMQKPGESAEEIQFRINGTDSRFASVNFEDAIAKQDKGLKERLSDLIGKPYSRTALGLFEIEQVRPAYFRQGYLRVAFGPPTVQLAADQKKPATAEDTTTSEVELTVPINKGAVYKLGEISWSGNSVVRTPELTALVQRAGLKTGDVADGVKLMGLWNAVQDEYGRFGYLDIQMDNAPDYDVTMPQVSYHVAITEGPQYHMGNLVLAGLSLEGERRIRSAWMLQQGATFNREYLDDFIASGAKQAFGDLPFHYQKIGTFLDKNPQTGVVNVMLDFQ